MATALDVIKRAMRLVGAYSIGETPSADESTDALSALNAMLASWANSGLMLYTIGTDTIPMVVGTSQYTLGPTGTVVTTRPTRIDASSYVTYQTVSYPVQILTREQYSSIPFKTQNGTLPMALFYEPAYPNGTLTIYPVPSDATVSLILKSWKPFTAFSALTDTIDFPPGYEECFAYNLAVRIAPEYQQPVKAEVAALASSSMKALKRTNTEVPLLGMPNVVLGGQYDSYSGWVL